MIIVNEQGELLQVLIHRNFDFPIACKMLQACKSSLQKGEIKRISINLERVIESNSCAIGAVLLVAEMVPEGFSIDLNECSAEVNYIFGSELLGKYIANASFGSVLAPSDCANCFSKNCQMPTGPRCEKDHLAGHQRILQQA
jgi:hypothetical protein